MKHVLLLGASGGIGKALSGMLLKDEYLVTQHCHRNGMGMGHPANLTNIYEVGRMMETVPPVDILINCTGVSSDAMTHKFDPNEWQRIINVNLVGAFNAIHAVLPGMRERKYGRIINLSSVVYQKPVMGTSAYSASKAGLAGLTHTVALENAALGITCNCISLGYFDAGMISKVPKGVLESIKQGIPLGRLGRVEEIYNTVQWMIDTEYVTGQVVNLNGGLYG